MSTITAVPNAIRQGDPHAAEQLLPLVYDDLRRLTAHAANANGTVYVLRLAAPP
jgi:hypothetical protein